MPQTLLLRLPASGQEETEWLTLDEAGAPTPTRQRGSLSLAAAVWRTGRIIALAPASQILLAEPQLPPGHGTKLARAVPFALEEQLTEDVDQLSFAIGHRRSSGGTPVAVVSRPVLQGWIDDLKAAGLDPQAIYPDISLMPENPSQTILWLEQERLAVRRPGALPFAVELSPVREALVVAGVVADPLQPEATEESKPKESAILYVTRDDWARVQGEFEELLEEFASLKVQLLADGPLPWLARGMAAAEPVNLLQGEFSRTTDYGTRWRQWRLAALLAAGLLVIHVGAQALQIRQAKHESTALDGEIAQVFSSAMPGDTLSDPRRQMQTKLDRIRKSGSGPQVFLRTLQTLSGALAVTPKTTISALAYREDALDMTVSAPSLAALSQLTQFAGKEGLSADIQSSNPVASGVEAHLHIRTQSSKARR
ncbi:MAG TPA: type II secretion system protein GspL [Steroidobacteraceae bacterium]|jgi:general secretion pathway protein L|nr:type II secretion system protein GspL [Steroidobacteraceae bacterium]